MKYIGIQNLQNLRTSYILICKISYIDKVNQILKKSKMNQTQHLNVSYIDSFKENLRKMKKE